MKIQNSLSICPEDEHRSLEKLRQETEYVCLKLAVKDWETFLAEVRLGNIIKQKFQFQRLEPINYEQSKPVPLNNSHLNSFLNELFGSVSTKRSPKKGRYCQCQSPICTEGRIPRISSNDPLSQQSSTRSLSDNNNINASQQEDPFQTYKLENLLHRDHTLQHQPLANIIQQLDRYANTQPGSPPGFSPFETFRNHSVDEQTLQENKVIEVNQEVSQYQRTAKKRKYCKNGQADVENSLQKIPSEEWIRNSGGLERDASMREFVLALQNTKLRKEIKVLSRILERQRLFQ